LAKIAGSDFGGHYPDCRRQKAWFLPAAHREAISSDISFVAAGERRDFRRLR
jgi:hypothetical protein